MPSQTIYIKDWIFRFDMSNMLVREQFHKFLQSEHNTEPLDFLIQVEKARTSLDKEQNEGRQLVLSLFDTFIADDSLKQVNLPGSIVRKMNCQMEALRQSQDKKATTTTVTTAVFDDMFQQAVEATRICLENDPWTRFVRSQSWQRFVKKKGKAFLEKVADPFESIQWGYTDNDFLPPHSMFLSEKDIDFLQSLCREDWDWKLIGYNRKNSVLSFKRDCSKLLPKCRLWDGCCAYQWRGVFDASFTELALICASHRYVLQIDPNVKMFKYVDYLDQNQLVEAFSERSVQRPRSQVTGFAYMKLPIPASSYRFLDMTFSVIVGEDKSLSFVFKPSYHPKIDAEVPRSTVRANSLFITKLTPIDEGGASRVMFQQIQILNWGGRIGKSKGLISDFMSVKRGEGFARLVNEKISRTRDNPDLLTKMVKDADANIDKDLSWRATRPLLERLNIIAPRGEDSQGSSKLQLPVTLVREP